MYIPAEVAELLASHPFEPLVMVTRHESDAYIINSATDTVMLEDTGFFFDTETLDFKGML